MTPREFRVALTRRAALDIELAAEYISKDSPQNANIWYERCIDATARLRVFPRRWGLVQEPALAKHGVRACRVSGYRVLFVVQDNRVVVLCVRHSAMRPLTLAAFRDRLSDRTEN